MMRKYPVWFPVAAIAALSAVLPARAQNTITFNAAPVAAQKNFAPGFAKSNVATGHTPFESGAIDNFQPGNWVEWNVTTTTPGLYKVDLVAANNAADPKAVFFLETRPASATDFDTHYASPDTKDYGNISSSDWLFVDLGNLKDASGNDITVPLWPGTNRLRLWDITERHIPANSYPPDEGDPNSRPWSTVWDGVGWALLRLGSVTLTRVGDLPQMGTISGTVTSDKPGGGVRRAMVTANPAGKAPTEVNPFWYNGYYTYTHADGSFSLQAPAGTTDVLANRASSFQLPGGLVSGVNVTAGATATANPQLKSLFHTDATLGGTVAFVQDEYCDFHTMNGSGNDAGFVPHHGENGYKVGWVQAGMSFSNIVDAPQAGLYKVTIVALNGSATDTGVTITTDKGQSTTATIPAASDWNAWVTGDGVAPIYLVQGANTVTQDITGPGWSDIDAIHLQLLPDVPTVGEVRGTVTDSRTGKPVQGATVTIGSGSVTTDEEGNYSFVGSLANNVSMTVTHPRMDAPITGTTNITSSPTVQNFTITLRPQIDLTTANGFNWKVIPNVGSAPDYSAVTADETNFQSIDVPGNWDTLPNAVSNMDSIVGWYRLHFTVPQDFLTALPNRNVILQIPGIDDVDATYLNGKLIGQTGQFPTDAIPVRPAGYTATPAGATRIYDAGAVNAWAVQRNYVIPASDILPGDNVLAIKVYDYINAGGITTTPSLIIAQPQGTITGTVKAGGTGVAGVRVTAEDLNGLASAYTFTGLDGSFTLKGVAAGPTLVGVAKPGYTATTVSAGSVGNNSTTNLNVTVSAITDGPAPSYDEFNAADWQDKWTAQSELDATVQPFITEPGRDVNDSASPTITGSLTIDGGTRERGALISKARFSKFASVNSARLVSALPATPDGTGGLPNAILQLYAPTTDDPTKFSYTNNVELDIEGYGSVNGTQHVNMMVWTVPGGNYTDIPVPIDVSTLKNVSAANPLDLTITRTGTVYDFYVNNVHAFGANFPNLASFPDHKVALYSYQNLAGEALTFDWVKAGPLAATPLAKGDLNANGLLDAGDVLTALRMAAGLATTTSNDVTAGNVTGGGAINIQDAARLLQAVNGKAL